MRPGANRQPIRQTPVTLRLTRDRSDAMGSRSEWPVVEGEPLRRAPEAARALAHRWDYRLVRQLLGCQA